MKQINVELLSEVFLIDIKHIIIVKEIRKFFDTLKNIEKELNSYIMTEFLFKKSNLINISFSFDINGEVFIHIYDTKLAEVLVIKPDTNNSVLIDNRLKEYKASEFLERVSIYFDDIVQFISNYNYYSNHYMTRDTMIKTIKEYNYIPITHEYFDDNEFIFNDKGIIKDENGYYFEDWGLSDYPNNYNGLRLRSVGNWETGWKIKVFDDWYNNILEKRR